MSLNPCPFCSHGNPADAKFCSACGGQLSLVPCPHCGAVNDVVATICYHCKGALQGRGREEPAVAPRAPEASDRVPRPHVRVLVGALAIATMAALGYYAYYQFSSMAPAPPPAAGSESARGSSASSGVIGRDAAAGKVTPAKAEGGAQPARPVAVSSEAPLADPTAAPAMTSRAERRAAESRDAKSASDAVAPSRDADTGKPGGQQPPRREACTEATAALGLCTMTDASGPVAPPRAADAGKAGTRQSTLPEACTEATAALGLCTPGPTQRKE